MKVLLLATVVALASGVSIAAQTANTSEVLEQEVRRVEMRDAEAVLRGDVATMEKSRAEDLIVHSNNQVTRGKADILRRIRAGDIGTYSTFVVGDREINQQYQTDGRNRAATLHECLDEAGR